MSRLLAGALLALAVLSLGCRRSPDVIAGGVYAIAETGGGYTISKVLVADASTVHLRSYKETFKDIPGTIDTSKLTVLIGHAPLARDGFLRDQPKLISVEKVSESELEGYRYYQKATGTER